jgi:hypothetical protein
MEIVSIRPGYFEEIPLRNDADTLVIEVASDRIIDCGIMDDESYRAFADADSDKGIRKEKWIPEIKKTRFSFHPKRGTQSWLILSNVYANKDASVAYDIRAAAS